jgi:hypothetical protein
MDNPKSETVEYNLFFTPKQTIALETINLPEVHDLMYGGSKGGGKSVFLCQWAFLRCHEIIQECKIETPEFPIPVGFLGRKRGSDFVKTTLETWKRIIPSGTYVIRPSDREIVIDGKVKIFYGGLDDENNVAKFNSAEFAFIGVDQAEEISRTDLALLKGTLRLIINGTKPAYKVLLTANPAPCFLKDDFIVRPDSKHRFIQALPFDNPYLDASYIESLTEAFKHRPELVRAYVHGSWDDLEGSDTLIKHSWVLSCVDNKIHYNQGRKVTSCDVARFGLDETVIYNFEDYKVVDQCIYGAKDAVYTASKIVEMAKKNKSLITAIDGDGMGGPVVDMVRNLLKDEPKYGVLEIHSGKVAEQETKFVNARSEMWFNAMDLFAEAQCSIPNDPEMIGQLISVKYSPNGSQGRFMLEKKQETKARLDRSPDRADALIYGLWAHRKCTPKQYDFRRTDVKLNTRQGYGWNNLPQGRYANTF